MIELTPVQRDRLEAFIADQRSVFDFERLFDAVLELQALMDSAPKNHYTEVANQTKSNFSTVQVFSTGPVIPADDLQVGDTFDVEWMCLYSANAATTPTFTFALKMGSTTIRSFAFATDVGVTNAEFYFRHTFVVKSIGVTGTIEAVGVRSFGNATDAGAGVLRTIRGSTPTLTTIDTTVDKTITATVNCSAAHANNTTTQRCLRITRNKSR